MQVFVQIQITIILIPSDFYWFINYYDLKLLIDKE